MNKKNVGIIFGGVSSEHEVSLKSAESIIKNISKEKYNIYMIGITKRGKWQLFGGNVDDVPSGKWENDKSNKSVMISNDPDVRGMIVEDKNGREEVRLDVVIPVLHGKNGEDGTIQGLFEIAGIPYVGCRTFASSACMDKICTNTMLAYFGVAKAKFHWFSKYDFETEPEKCLDDTEKIIKTYPMFVKPSNAGSSVGISKVNNRDELREGVKTALKEDTRVLIEEGINGREIECAVLGNGETKASVVGEIVPCNDFYDYDAKYIDGDSKLFIPAKLDDKISDEIRNLAKQAYKIMDCRGLSRIDFFVERKTNKVYLNEINTFPGFTSISMYPKLMEATGLGFEQLIDKLIELALEK